MNRRAVLLTTLTLLTTTLAMPAPAGAHEVMCLHAQDPMQFYSLREVLSLSKYVSPTKPSIAFLPDAEAVMGPNDGVSWRSGLVFEVAYYDYLETQSTETGEVFLYEVTGITECNPDEIFMQVQGCIEYPVAACQPVLQLLHVVRSELERCTEYPGQPCLLRDIVEWLLCVPVPHTAYCPQNPINPQIK